MPSGQPTGKTGETWPCQLSLTAQAWRRARRASPRKTGLNPDAQVVAPGVWVDRRVARPSADLTEGHREAPAPAPPRLPQPRPRRRWPPNRRRVRPARRRGCAGVAELLPRGSDDLPAAHGGRPGRGGSRGPRSEACPHRRSDATRLRPARGQHPKRPGPPGAPQPVAPADTRIRESVARGRRRGPEGTRRPSRADGAGS